MTNSTATRPCHQTHLESYTLDQIHLHLLHPKSSQNGTQQRGPTPIPPAASSLTRSSHTTACPLDVPQSPTNTGSNPPHVVRGSCQSLLNVSKCLRAQHSTSDLPPRVATSGKISGLLKHRALLLVRTGTLRLSVQRQSRLCR